MSIRLKIISLWLPDYFLKKDLDIVAKNTIEGLNRVLKKYTPWRLDEVIEQDELLKGSAEKRRSIMANAHNRRVKVLIEEFGYEEAVKIARKAMFEVGFQLGQKARLRLGVGDDFKDLQHAAKIMYKVLGIDFKIENRGKKFTMIVNRCALSKYYTPEACIVLSAADEGVVRGLNQNMKMEFKERITGGASECIACISEVKT
ncbi:L-2-amino-thiazoline-4-carboxylic acid hydrolase [Methanobacterium sp. ACI-7]|uniref:L-2-amino-thiazoline-4-carboxylic acid hydrolase n=1 Tax=unclassified Methanobacterium TaxID=2627676 RepID=UPI0039C30412